MQSGVAHFRCASEDECLKEIRRLISYLPDNNLTDPEIWPADDDLNRWMRAFWNWCLMYPTGHTI